MQYLKSHEWIVFEGDDALIGISDYAQQQMGDIVYADLPVPGDDVEAEDEFAYIESVKAVSSLYSPVTGVISEVNTALNDAPELLNEAPLTTWIIKVKDVTDKAELLSEDEYVKFLAEEE